MIGIESPVDKAASFASGLSLTEILIRISKSCEQLPANTAGWNRVLIIGRTGPAQSGCACLPPPQLHSQLALPSSSIPCRRHPKQPPPRTGLSRRSSPRPEAPTATLAVEIGGTLRTQLVHPWMACCQSAEMMTQGIQCRRKGQQPRRQIPVQFEREPRGQALLPVKGTAEPQRRGSRRCTASGPHPAIRGGAATHGREARRGELCACRGAPVLTAAARRWQHLQWGERGLPRSPWAATGRYAASACRRAAATPPSSAFACPHRAAAWQAAGPHGAAKTCPLPALRAPGHWPSCSSSCQYERRKRRQCRWPTQGDQSRHRWAPASACGASSSSNALTLPHLCSQKCSNRQYQPETAGKGKPARTTSR